MKTLSEKISFSKFLPDSQQYVVIRGYAKSPDDFDLSINIGDGADKVTFNLDPWNNIKETNAMLKAMRDSMQQALEFYEKALNLPAIPASGDHWFASLKPFAKGIAAGEKKPAVKAKGEARKKKVAAKK